MGDVDEREDSEKKHMKEKAMVNKARRNIIIGAITGCKRVYRARHAPLSCSPGQKQTLELKTYSLKFSGIFFFSGF